jgi:sugar lactone lactonase YvrE
VVTTLAGTVGQAGGANGMGSAAQFSGPASTAVDGAGNVYVADTGNNALRKITPAGVVTTLRAEVAESIISFADSPGEFSLAVDGAGNVYTADSFEILKITPAGVATIVSSLGSHPGDFFGLAVDGLGNFYVADSEENEILKITPDGALTTTLAGASLFGSADGAAGTAQFNGPRGVAVDGPGNIYVADTGNDTIRKIAPAGVVTTIAGLAGRSGSADGTGSAALFNSPSAIAVDGAGNLYVADTGNDTIRQITPAGVVTTLAGTAGQAGSVDGTGSAALFFNPSGVAVDSAGNLYVGDTGNDTIRKITPSGVVTTLAGTVGQAGGANGMGSAAQFSGPASTAVDGAGNVYVAEPNNGAIRKITASGTVTTLAVPGFGGFSSAGVAVDNAGNVYVTDGNTIGKITPAGTMTTLAGTPSLYGGNVDGTGPVAQFNYPVGVAVDSAGNVYVADTNNSTIRKGSPALGPLIATQPQSQFVNVGSDAVLAVAALGNSALSYQWYLYGSPIAGATEATLTIDNVQAASVGAYQVEVTDASGDETTSGNAILTINPALSSVIAGQPISQTITTGGTVTFTIAANVPGPALALTSYQWQFNGVDLTDGAGISGSGTAQLVIQGAGTADDGDYSCLVITGGGSAQSNTASLLVITTSSPGYAAGISTRAFVGTGDNILIGGFYIVGSTSRTVLIQALGPALAPLGVTDALQHPALSIHQTQNGQDVTLYSNTGWGGSQILLDAAASAFATPVLTAGSADSELLVTLPPGGYSAEVSGADGGTGVALCAIYQLP